MKNLKFRYTALDADAPRVKSMAEATGFFSPEEVAIAIELVNERLVKGDVSGYYFIFAEQEEGMIGYACFGPIAGTKHSFDLYWIVVHPDHQGKGIGKRLMEESESAILKIGGRRIYVDTSSRDQYKPTRSFYVNCGYVEEAVLRDFYSPGDSKVIFSKRIGAES